MMVFDVSWTGVDGSQIMDRLSEQRGRHVRKLLDRPEQLVKELWTGRSVIPIDWHCRIGMAQPAPVSKGPCYSCYLVGRLTQLGRDRLNQPFQLDLTDDLVNHQRDVIIRSSPAQTEVTMTKDHHSQLIRSHPSVNGVLIGWLLESIFDSSPHHLTVHHAAICRDRLFRFEDVAPQAVKLEWTDQRVISLLHQLITIITRLGHYHGTIGRVDQTSLGFLEEPFDYTETWNGHERRLQGDLTLKLAGFDQLALSIHRDDDSTLRIAPKLDPLDRRSNFIDESNGWYHFKLDRRRDRWIQLANYELVTGQHHSLTGYLLFLVLLSQPGYFDRFKFLFEKLWSGLWYNPEQAETVRQRLLKHATEGSTTPPRVYCETLDGIDLRSNLVDYLWKNTGA